MRGQRHAPAALYPRERTGTHCTGGWVGPGPVWTRAENITPTGIRSLDRPARSQSLYRLRYPAHSYVILIALPRQQWLRQSYPSLQNSSLESSCVVVALIENFSTSKPLKGSPEKSQILRCDTLVANE